VAHKWVRGPNLWMIGFDLGSLQLIQWLSGIVEVLDIVYDGDDKALLFVVRSKDPKAFLKRKHHGLVGTELRSFRLGQQAPMVAVG